MSLNNIQWPSDLNPQNSPVYTHNELEMPAKPNIVWAWLIRATRWPEWYSNCKDVKIVEGESKVDLSQGAVFMWKTFGMRVVTRVEVFEPFTQLAWRGKGFLGKGYHAWLIEETQNGCKVITEEVQSGFMISIGRRQIKQRLLKEHQNWLKGLAKMSTRSSGDVRMQSLCYNAKL